MLLDQISIISWIQNNSIKTENGDILDFHTYRFLYDIYTDRSPFICAIKAAQIGFTTYEILKSAHEAYNENIDIIYVLPTADDVKTFSGGKTNRIIANNPVMQEWTNDKDSVEQKRFGKATIYYRGSWTERTALMISAKKLIIDELDRCKKDIIEQYDSRLQGTINPRKAYFSNPTIPDFGIDKYWKQSDQKKWHITHSCGEKYILDESCIDYETEVYRCPKCKHEIIDEERRMGEWIATASGEWSGYWIPLWINPRFSAEKIANYKRTKTSEYFANFVAGLPYIDSDDKISPSWLFKSLSPDVNTQNGRVIIGLDTGNDLYYTMMNKEGVFYYGHCDRVDGNPNYDPYDEIEKRLKEYKNSVLVADQGGDLIGIQKLQAKYPGRVYLCMFSKETKNKELIRWGEKENNGMVYADRNRVIQLIVEQLKEQRIIFNGTEEEWNDFFVHCLNIYRTKEITDENEPSYGWRWVWKRNGPDHWFFSMVYAIIGYDRFKEDLATFVKKDEFMKGVKTGSNRNGGIPAKRFIKGDRVDII